jgi:1-acyl-sn-glycerol-3-phosphate acyltransferase
VKTLIGNWRQQFNDYVDLCLTSGFIPKSLRPLQLVGKFLAILWVYIQVGRVQVIGKHNLLAPGRIVFCPNHSSMFDALVIFSIMRRMPRYMTAYEEMQGLWGLKAIIMGAFGCFAVDRSQGKTVIEPAIQVLVSNEPLVIFPEGKISPSGTYLPFKKGISYIGLGAYDRLAGRDRVGFVPMHICYGKRHEDTAISPYGAMGFRWRGGVIVTILEPIYIDMVEPRTPEAITSAVRQSIVSQACATTRLSEDNQSSLF